ncbi:MAG TPA: transposase, partial [Chloroflexota bacterium]|nr:transposase [Chloroflexota bacterium]
LHWSRWRRRHQARAKRAHTARRARRPAVLPPAPARPPLPPRHSPELTEAAWQRVCPLLPPLRTPRGRPYVDHRRIVAGMLWVERTGCAWAALPDRFGPWQSVYHRFQRWRASGLWGQILAVLDDHEAQHVAA